MKRIVCWFRPDLAILRLVIFCFIGVGQIARAEPLPVSEKVTLVNVGGGPGGHIYEIDPAAFSAADSYWDPESQLFPADIAALTEKAAGSLKLLRKVSDRLVLYRMMIKCHSDSFIEKLQPKFDGGHKRMPCFIFFQFIHQPPLGLPLYRKDDLALVLLLNGTVVDYVLKPASGSELEQSRR